MRLLLDTHVLLWAVSDPGRLSGESNRGRFPGEVVALRVRA